MSKKALVVGWFSFEQCNVTAGDLMAKDVACEWLEQAGYSYDVALLPPFSEGIDFWQADPKNYSHAVFVCGPFPYIDYSKQFIEKFKDCCLIGLDLSMIEPLGVWNPFDVLLERDSHFNTRPDISFAAHQKKVPIVGVILAEPQAEYRQRAKHQIANDAIDRLTKSRQCIVVPIDTRLDPNTTNLHTAAEIESMIARMDLVITTRLHGMVLSLKNEVPVVAIDAISGGAKVTRQAETIGWNIVFSVTNLNDEKLQQAFDYCLSEDGRRKAGECRTHALASVNKIREEFIAAMSCVDPRAKRIYLKEQLESMDSGFSPSYPSYHPIRAYWKLKSMIRSSLFLTGNWLVEVSHYDPYK